MIAKEEINIEEIMNQIREDIKEKGIDERIPQFSEIASEGLQSHIAYDPNGFSMRLVLLWQGLNFQINQPIQSRKGPIGKLIIFFKKIVRKIIRFYMEPFAAHQREQNRLLVECLEILKNYTLEKDSITDKVEDLEFHMNKELVQQLTWVQNSYRSIIKENRMLKNQATQSGEEINNFKQSLAIMQKQVELLELEIKQIKIQMDSNNGVSQ